jgi:peptidoglycan/LPS O-acetylase OafA/YrhL
MAVVLYHFRPLYSGNFSIEAHTLTISRGYLWVDFFFLLSGFVLCHVYAEDFLRRRLHFREFLGKRLARIYPMHLFTLLVLLIPFFGASGDRLSFSTNLLLLHAWGTDSQLAWNYPSWSISAEWAAYLAFPAILTVFYRGPLALAVSLAGAGIFGLDMLAAHLHPGPGHSFNHMSYSFGWLRCIVLFSTGVVIYRIYTARLSFLGSDWTFAVVAACLLAAMHFGVADAVIVFCFCGLLCVAAQNEGWPNKLLSWKPLYFLGVISYSIYMTQALVQFAFEQRPIILFVRGLSPPVALLVYLAECLSVIAVAAVTYRIVELPGRAFVQSLLQRQETSSGIAKQA